jgi:hypothetical protein
MSINGHRVLILGQDRENMEEGLDVFGADSVKEVVIGDSRDEQESALRKMAERVQGGVIIAPTEVGLEELIANLRDQLPWIQ